MSRSLKVDQVSEAFAAVPGIVIEIEDFPTSPPVSINSGTYTAFMPDTGSLSTEIPISGLYRVDLFTSPIAASSNVGTMRIKAVFDESLPTETILGDDDKWQFRGSTADDYVHMNYTGFVELEAGTRTIKVYGKIQDGTQSFDFYGNTDTQMKNQLKLTLVSGSGAGGEVLVSDYRGGNSDPITVVQPTFEAPVESGAGPQMYSITATVLEDEELVVQLFCMARANTTAFARMVYKLVLDGTTTLGAFQISSSSTSNDYGTLAIQRTTGPLSAGDHTVHVECAKWTAGEADWVIQSGQLVVRQMRGGQVPWEVDGVPIHDTPRAINIVGGVASVTEEDGKINLSMPAAVTAVGQAERLISTAGADTADWNISGTSYHDFGAGAAEATLVVPARAEYIFRLNIGAWYVSGSGTNVVYNRIIINEGEADEVIPGGDSFQHFPTPGATDLRSWSGEFGPVTLEAGTHTVKIQGKTRDSGDVARVTSSNHLQLFAQSVTGSGAGGTLTTETTDDTDTAIDGAAPDETTVTALTQSSIETSEGEHLFVSFFGLGQMKASGATGMRIILQVDSGFGPVTKHTINEDSNVLNQIKTLTFALPVEVTAGTHEVSVVAAKSMTGGGANWSLIGTTLPSKLTVTRYRGGLVPFSQDGTLIQDKPHAVDFLGPGLQATNVDGKVTVSANSAAEGVDDWSVNAASQAVSATSAEPLPTPAEITGIYCQAGEVLVISHFFKATRAADGSLYCYPFVYKEPSGTPEQAGQATFIRLTSGSFTNTNSDTTFYTVSETGYYTIELYAFRTNANHTLSQATLRVAKFKGGYVTPENTPKLEYNSTASINVVPTDGAASRLWVLLNDGQRYYSDVNPTIDMTASGLGGLETSATESADTWYYAYAVPSATTGIFDVIASENDPATGPADYSAWKYLGAFYNNTSSDIRRFVVNGDEVYFPDADDVALMLYYLSNRTPAVSVWFDTGTAPPTSPATPGGSGGTGELRGIQYSIPVEVASHVQLSGQMDGDTGAGGLYVDSGEVEYSLVDSGTQRRGRIFLQYQGNTQQAAERWLPLYNNQIKFGFGSTSGYATDLSIVTLGYRDRYLIRKEAQLQAEYTPDTPTPKGTWIDATQVDFAAWPGHSSTMRLALSDGKTRVASGTLTVDTAVGVDDFGYDHADSQGNSKWLYFYAVPKTGDDDQFAIVMSDNAPDTGPQGRAASKYIWATYIDGSGNLREIIQDGPDFWFPAVVTLGAGHGFNGTPDTLETIDLSDVVPDTASNVSLFGKCSSSGWCRVDYRVYGNSGNTRVIYLSTADENWEIGPIPLPGTPKRYQQYYDKAGTGGGTISFWGQWVRGYRDEYLAADAGIGALAGGGGGATSPLTTKGDIWTYDINDQRIGVGTDGQLLSANSVESTGLEWIDPPSASPLTTKGDVYTYDTDNQRLAVGADGQALVADSAEATGLKWADISPALTGTAAEIVELIKGSATTTRTVASAAWADIDAVLEQTFSVSQSGNYALFIRHQCYYSSGTYAVGHIGFVIDEAGYNGHPQQLVQILDEQSQFTVSSTDRAQGSLYLGTVSLDAGTHKIKPQWYNDTSSGGGDISTNQYSPFHAWAVYQPGALPAAVTAPGATDVATQLFTGVTISSGTWTEFFSQTITPTVVGKHRIDLSFTTYATGSSNSQFEFKIVFDEGGADEVTVNGEAWYWRQDSMVTYKQHSYMEFAELAAKAQTVKVYGRRENGGFTLYTAGNQHAQVAITALAGSGAGGTIVTEDALAASTGLTSGSRPPTNVTPGLSLSLNCVVGETIDLIASGIIIGDAIGTYDLRFAVDGTPIRSYSASGESTTGNYFINASFAEHFVAAATQHTITLLNSYNGGPFNFYEGFTISAHQYRGGLVPITDGTTTVDKPAKQKFINAEVTDVSGVAEITLPKAVTAQGDVIEAISIIQVSNNTTSGTFVDVPNTDTSFTSEVSGDFFVTLDVDMYVTSAGTGGHFQVVIDEGLSEEKVVGTDDTRWRLYINPASTHTSKTFTGVVEDLSAGTHTIKVQWRRATGSGTMTQDGNSHVKVTLQAITGSGAGGMLLDEAVLTADLTGISGSGNEVKLNGLDLEFTTTEGESVAVSWNIQSQWDATYSTQSVLVRIDSGSWEAVEVDNPPGYWAGFAGTRVFSGLSAGSHTVEFGFVCNGTSTTICGGDTALFSEYPAARTWAMQYRGGLVPITDGTNTVSTPHKQIYRNAEVADEYGAAVITLPQAVTAQGEHIEVLGSTTLPASNTNSPAGWTQIIPWPSSFPGGTSEAGEDITVLNAGEYNIRLTARQYIITGTETVKYKVVFDENESNEQTIGDDVFWTVENFATTFQHVTLTRTVTLTAGAHTVKVYGYCGTSDRWRHISPTSGTASPPKLELEAISGSGAAGTMVEAVDVTTGPTALGSAESVLISKDVTVVEGENVLVSFVGTLRSSAGNNYCLVTLRDGGLTGTVISRFALQPYLGGSDNQNASFSYIVTDMTAGDHTLAVTVDPSGTTAEAWYYQMQVTKFRGGLVPITDGTTTVSTPNKQKYVNASVEEDNGTAVITLPQAVTAQGTLTTIFTDDTLSDTTTSATFVDVSGASATFEVSEAGEYLISFFANGVWANTSWAQMRWRLDIDDGDQVTPDTNEYEFACVPTGTRNGVRYQSKFTLTAGTHTVKVQWRRAEGTGTLTLDSRSHLSASIQAITGSGAGGTLLDSAVLSSDEEITGVQATPAAVPGLSVTVDCSIGEWLTLSFAGLVRSRAAPSTAWLWFADGSTLIGSAVWGKGTNDTAYIQDASATVAFQATATSHTFNVYAADNAGGDNWEVQAGFRFEVMRYRGGLVPFKNDEQIVTSTPIAVNFVGPNVQVTNVDGQANIQFNGVTGEVETTPFFSELAGGVAAPTTGSGSYTVGTRFSVTREGCRISGGFFYTAIAGAHTIRVKLWEAGNATALASVDVACSGAGEYEGRFAEAYEVADADVPNKDFYISIWETSGTNWTQWGSAPYFNQSYVHRFHTVWERPKSYAAGDANPEASDAASAMYAVDVILTSPGDEAGYVQPENIPTLEYNSASVINVVKQSGASDRLWLRLNDGQRYYADGTQTVDLTASGLGGLDTGSEATSTWYYCYAVPSATGGIFDVVVSATNPATGPTGYSAWRYLGCVYNNSSGDIRKFRYEGPWHHTDNESTDIEVLSIANGSPTVGAWTALSIDVAVPSGMYDAVQLDGFNLGNSGKYAMLHVEPATPSWTPTDNGTNSVRALLFSQSLESVHHTRRQPVTGGLVYYCLDRGGGSPLYAQLYVRIPAFRDKYLTRTDSVMAAESGINSENNIIAVEVFT